MKDRVAEVQSVYSESDHRQNWKTQSPVTQLVGNCILLQIIKDIQGLRPTDDLAAFKGKKNLFYEFFSSLLMIIWHLYIWHL